MGTTPKAEILNGMNRTTSQPILARASHCSNIALTSELLAVCNEPPSPVFLWCTGSCFLYWTLAWKLKRAGWIVLSLKIKKTVACLKSPQRQLIVKKWWSQLELNQRHKKFQSFALPTELWDHGTDRKSWTHINGFWRPLLYHWTISVYQSGADNGNRTRIASLGSWSSNHWTISAFGAPEETRTLTHLSISF